MDCCRLPSIPHGADHGVQGYDEKLGSQVPRLWEEGDHCRGVVQFSGLSYSRTQLCNWPVSRFDIGNIICWIGWSIDTYIGTVGTLFVLPCSLFIVISFGARAWGIVWARLAILSCYFVVVPSTTLGFEPRTSSCLYTSEHCRNHHRSTRKRLSGRYRQSRRARVDVAGDNKSTLPTRGGEFALQVLLPSFFLCSSRFCLPLHCFIFLFCHYLYCCWNLICIVIVQWFIAGFFDLCPLCFYRYPIYMLRESAN